MCISSTYQSTSKMKLVDVKSRNILSLIKKNKKEDPKFKIGDHVRISNYKNIFVKGYIPNRSEEVLRLKQLKMLFLGHLLLVILTVKKF